MSKRRKPMAEINVVPYIDVTFVLLIIFMVTAPLQQSNIEVDLPVAGGTSVESNQSLPVIITVDKQGLYYLSVEGEDGHHIDKQQLLSQINALYKKNPHIQIYIRGDKKVEYGQVVTIMAALKNSGIMRVGLLTLRNE